MTKSFRFGYPLILHRSPQFPTLVSASTCRCRRSPRRTSVAAVGAVLNALVIPKQAILCNLLSSAWFVLSLNLGHHTVTAYVTMGLTTAVYIQYITFGFSLQVFQNVPLHVQKALQALLINLSSCILHVSSLV
jgi:hypothetical protein